MLMLVFTSKHSCTTSKSHQHGCRLIFDTVQPNRTCFSSIVNIVPLKAKLYDLVLSLFEKVYFQLQ